MSGAQLVMLFGAVLVGCAIGWLAWEWHHAEENNDPAEWDEYLDG